MENKEINIANNFTLTNGKTKLVIVRNNFTSKDSAKTFENFYKLGKEMERLGLVKTLSYAGGAKYFPWSVIQHIMSSIYGKSFKKIIKYDMDDRDAGQPYREFGPMNSYVEAGFKLADEEYTTLLPILNSKHMPVENLTSSIVNSAIQRCGVKAVAERTGLGLHLWDGDIIIEDTTNTLPPLKVYIPPKKKETRTPNDQKINF